MFLILQGGDSASKEKLTLVVTSLRDFWNQEKLRRELEYHLQDLKENLEIQKGRLDEEANHLSSSNSNQQLDMMTSTDPNACILVSMS